MFSSVFPDAAFLQCVCMRVHVHACVHTCMHVCMHACVRACVCVRARLCVCVFVFNTNNSTVHVQPSTGVEKHDVLENTAMWMVIRLADKWVIFHFGN